MKVEEERLCGEAEIKVTTIANNFKGSYASCVIAYVADPWDFPKQGVRFNTRML